MARPARIEYEGAFYHVMNRGNRKEAIFIDNKDRAKFYEIVGNIENKYGVKPNQLTNKTMRHIKHPDLN